LLEKDDWKRSDMFFEYRLKEGEDLRLKVLAINFMDKAEIFQKQWDFQTCPLTVVTHNTFQSCGVVPGQ
jgi:hypothetical protein